MSRSGLEVYQHSKSTFYLINTAISFWWSPQEQRWTVLPSSVFSHVTTLSPQCVRGAVVFFYFLIHVCREPTNSQSEVAPHCRQVSV